MKDQNISRLEIFCNDAAVMPIKRMLLGMKGIHEIKDQLVVNAVASKKDKVAQRTSGRGVDMFEEYLREHKIKQVNADIGREFQKSIGRAKGGYNSVFAQAIAAGFLKKDKVVNHKYQTYTVHWE